MSPTPSPRQVVSSDGTPIGYWASGVGPPLVLVHGATADHSRWRPLLPHLEPHVTVYAMDRRGRGASGDALEYDIEREFEDVAAVVDAVAAESTDPVDLLGHSYGGLCALGAATLTNNVGRLVLYEPSALPDDRVLTGDVMERIEELLAAGRRADVLNTFFREVVQMPEHELVRLRSLPAWQARIAAAHTLMREFKAVDGAFDAERTRGIQVATLLIQGGDSPDFVRRETELVASALPNQRTLVMEGQQHVAMDMAPGLFAAHVLDFLRGGGG